MELLTVQETAAMLKVAPITVRRYIASGRLPAVRVGRGVRVQREAVEALVKPVAPAGKLPKRRSPARRSRVFTFDDPLWNIVGMFSSDGPGDVSQNKYKYLAEAYADTHETPGKP